MSSTEAIDAPQILAAPGAPDAGADQVSQNRHRGLGALVAAHPDALALVLLLTLAALPRLILLTQAPIFTFTDSTGYLEPGYDLAAGEGVTNRLKRPIGYPLLLAGALAGSGMQLGAVAAVQHGLGLGLVGLVYLLGRWGFDRRVGFGAGLLTALSAAQLVSEHAVMSEVLFTLLLVGAAAGLVRVLAGPRLWPVALVGALLGVSALVRPVGQMLVPLALVVVALRPDTRRSRLLAAGVLLAAYAAVVTPWMARNAAVLGRFTIGGTPGESLLARTLAYGEGRFTFDGPAIPPAADPAHQTARRVIQEGLEAADPPSVVSARVRQELRLTPAEADQLVQRVVLETIGRQPLAYLGLIPEGLLSLYLKPDPLTAAMWRSRLNWETHADFAALVQAAPPPNGEQGLGWTAATLDLYRPSRHGLVLLALGALGAGLGLRRWRANGRARGRAGGVLLLAGLVGYLAVVHVALDGPVGRYRYPTEPLLNVLAVGGALGFLTWSGWTRGGARAGRPGRALVVSLFILVLGALAWPRLHNLDRFDPNPSGNEYDEGIRLVQLSLMADGFRPFRDIYASQGPLLLDLFYPFFELFGREVVGARAPSALASLVCMAAMGLTAGRLGGAWCGLAALAMLGLSTEFLRLSRLALAEAPSLAPAAAALGLAVVARGRGDGGTEGRRDGGTEGRSLSLCPSVSPSLRPSVYVAASGLTFALALLLKPMAFPVAAGVVAALAIGRRPAVWLREVGLWGAAAGGACGAVVAAIGPDLLYEYFVEYRQGAAGVGALGRAEWSLLGNLGTVLRELGPDLALLALAGVALPVVWRANRLYAAVAGSWLGATLLMLLVYSPLSSKHVAYLLPPAALLAAGAALAFGRRVGEWESGRVGEGGTEGQRDRETERRGDHGAGLPLSHSPSLPLSIAAGLFLYILNLQPVLAADVRLTRPSTRALSSSGDLADALAIIRRVSGPEDFVVTDHPYLAYLAKRRVPPRLADPSRTRIRSGSLGAAEAIEQTEAYRPKAVVVWAGRFPALWQYAAWLEERYRVARVYDGDRAVYVRADVWAETEPLRTSAAPRTGSPLPRSAPLPGQEAPSRQPGSGLARFGGLVELSAAEVRPSGSGREQRLMLTWQALRPIPPEFYLARVELRDGQGRVALSRDDLLVPPWRLTPWGPGAPISHRRWLDLDYLDGGQYAIVLRVTLGPGGRALPAEVVEGRLEAGPAAGEVVLGRVSLQERQNSQ